MPGSCRGRTRACGGNFLGGHADSERAHRHLQLALVNRAAVVRVEEVEGFLRRRRQGKVGFGIKIGHRSGRPGKWTEMGRVETRAGSEEDARLELGDLLGVSCPAAMSLSCPPWRRSRRCSSSSPPVQHLAAPFASPSGRRGAPRRVARPRPKRSPPYTANHAHEVLLEFERPTTASPPRFARGRVSRRGENAARVLSPKRPKRTISGTAMFSQSSTQLHFPCLNYYVTSATRYIVTVCPCGEQAHRIIGSANVPNAAR